MSRPAGKRQRWPGWQIQQGFSARPPARLAWPGLAQPVRATSAAALETPAVTHHNQRAYSCLFVPIRAYSCLFSRQTNAFERACPMTTSPSRHALALASITALGLFAAPAAPAAPAARSDPQARPFMATVTTQETLAPNPAACPQSILQGTTTGQGHATPMGRVTISATDCIALGATQFTFTNGVLLIVAANGDRLTADYSGALLPTAAYPVYSLSGSFRITGGSGRFSGASGAGSLRGVNNVVTGQGAYVATGTITYAAHGSEFEPDNLSR